MLVAPVAHLAQLLGVENGCQRDGAAGQRDVFHFVAGAIQHAVQIEVDAVVLVCGGQQTRGARHGWLHSRCRRVGAQLEQGGGDWRVHSSTQRGRFCGSVAPFASSAMPQVTSAISSTAASEVTMRGMRFTLRLRWRGWRRSPRRRGVERLPRLAVLLGTFRFLHGGVDRQIIAKLFLKGNSFAITLSRSILIYHFLVTGLQWLER